MTGYNGRDACPGVVLGDVSQCCACLMWCLTSYLRFAVIKVSHNFLKVFVILFSSGNQLSSFKSIVFLLTFFFVQVPCIMCWLFLLTMNYPKVDFVFQLRVCWRMSRLHAYVLYTPLKLISYMELLTNQNLPAWLMVMHRLKFILLLLKKDL